MGGSVASFMRWGSGTPSFRRVRPDHNAPSIDNVLGETTLDGILRVLAIPAGLLGLHASAVRVTNMIRTLRADTQWAIAATISITTLERLATPAPDGNCKGHGSQIVAGKEAFAALLVFSDLPNEALAKQLLSDYDSGLPARFSRGCAGDPEVRRKKTRVTETRVAGHPADFLDERGITTPGYDDVPSPVAAVGIVEGATLAEAKRAMPDAEIEFRAHSRGVLVID